MREGYFALLIPSKWEFSKEYVQTIKRLLQCYVVCEMEKTICPLPRLKFILNSIKNVHAPMKLQCVISATKGWEYFSKDYL